MGTNENLKNIGGNNEKNLNVYNTGESVGKNVIDMQATQRINISADLMKNTENTIKGIFANQKSVINHDVGLKVEYPNVNTSTIKETFAGNKVQGHPHNMYWREYPYNTHGKEYSHNMHAKEYAHNVTEKEKAKNEEYSNKEQIHSNVVFSSKNEENNNFVYKNVENSYSGVLSGANAQVENYFPNATPNQIVQKNPIQSIDKSYKENVQNTADNVNITEIHTENNKNEVINMSTGKMQQGGIQNEDINKNITNIYQENTQSTPININAGEITQGDFQDKTVKINLGEIYQEGIQNSITNVAGAHEENMKITNTTTDKNNEKQNVQDKKDYRLEKMLFDRINKMQGKIKESLELIKKFERINAKEENLPNIVTTLHDKLTHEVIKQFRTVGIEFNMKSYLVQSIVSDLLCKFEEGITEFKECSENLNFVKEVQEDFETRVDLAPTSKFKNLFARLRGMFKPERKQEKLEELERARQEKKLEEANIHLIKYKFINSELERYTIRKNIVSSLTREILYEPSSGLTLSISEFINEKIVQEMEKLGLAHLIDELKDNLYDEYKAKNASNLSNSKEQFLGMSVSEVRKIMKLQKVESITSKVANVATGNARRGEDERMVV